MTWVLAAIVMIPVVILIQLAMRGNAVAILILVLGCLNSFAGAVAFLFIVETDSCVYHVIDPCEMGIDEVTWAGFSFLSGILFWPASIFALVGSAARKAESESKLLQQVKDIVDKAENE